MSAPANWSPAPVTNLVPTTADIARWNAASYANQPTVDTTLTFGQLMFDNGNTAGVTLGGSSALTLNRLDGVGLQVNNSSGSITINAPIYLGFSQTWVNNLTSGSGALTLGGTVSGQKLTVSGPGDITITGAASPSSLAMNGTGTLRLGGSSPNATFTVYVNSGTVLLDKSAGGNNIAIPGALSIGQANATTSTVQYVGSSTNMIADGAAVNIYGPSRLDFNGKTDIIAGLGINSTGATNDTTPIVNTAGGGTRTITTLTITPLPGYKTTIDSGAGGTLKSTADNLTFNAAGTGVAEIKGILDLNGATRVIYVYNGDADNDLVISAVVTNGALTSSQPGRLVLTGNNSYDGLTTVSGGILNIANASALGTTVNGTTVGTGYTLELQHPTGIAVGAEPLTLNNTGIYSYGALRNVSGNNSWNGPITLSVNAVRINSDSDTLTLNSGATIGGNFGLTVGGMGNVAMNGDIDIVNTTGLTKDGAGTLTLAGAILQTGPTTVNGGTLALDLSSGSTSKTWLQGGTLNLYKGALELKGGSQTEIFANTVVQTSGSFGISRSSGTSKLRLNALTRAIGGTIDFAADNLADTDTANSSGILNVGGAATVGSNTWAQSAASGTDISITGLPDSGYVANGANLQGSISSSSNLDMRTSSQDTTVTNVATINSIRFNIAEPRTITINGSQSLTVTSGGILNTANVGGNSSTITGAGTLTTPGNVDLVVHQYNPGGSLAINSILTVGSTRGITKTGPGTLSLGGTAANTVPANTYVNGGTLELNKTANVNAIANGGLVINQTGIVKYTGTSTDMIGNTCAIAINEAGQLDFNGKNDTIAAVTINSTGAGGNTTPIKNTAGGGTLTISSLTITPVSGYTTTVNSASGTLALGGDVIFGRAGNGVVQLSGNINMGAAARGFYPQNGDADADVIVGAVLSGTVTANNNALTVRGNNNNDNNGRLVLSGNNTFTGNTTIGLASQAHNVVLNLQHSNALGATGTGHGVVFTGNGASTLELQGGISVGNEPLSLTGGGYMNYGVLRNVSGNNSWAGAITLAGVTRINSDSDTLTLNSGTAISGAQALYVGGLGNTTISSAIGIGAGTLTKDGAGTLTLSGANTLTGATTVNGGTLVLDYSTQNNTKLADGAALNLYKGTLTLSGGSHPEVVGSTTLNAGAFVVNRSSGTSVLRMNAITRTIGSTIDFATDNIADTDTINYQGILGISGSSGYATVGSNTWARSADSGTDISITGLPDSGYVTNTAWSLGTTTSNCDVRVADTIVTVSPINSIRFNEAAPRTITIGGGGLTVTSGGILNTATVGANTNTITGNTLTSATDLKIHQYNTSAPLRIDSPISIVNTMALTKSGPGTLILGSWTANSGNVVVNGGELDLDKSASQAIAGPATLTINQNGIVKYTGSYDDQIGTGTIAINENGQLDFNGKSDSLGGILSITSTGASGDTTPIKNSGSGGNLTWGGWLSITPLTGYRTLIDSGTGTNTLGGLVYFYAAGSGWAQISGNLSLSNASREFAVADGEAFNDMVVDATIVGGGASGALSKSGVGRLVLSGNNSYDGLTTVNGGFLTISNAAALGASGGSLAVNGTTVNRYYTLELLGGISVGAEALSLTDTGVGGYGALRNVSGNNSWGGPITLSAWAVRINSDKDTLTLSGEVTSVGAIGLTIGGAGDTTISGALDVTSLNKDGTGTLTLSGATKRTGVVTVSGGKLVLDYTGADNLKITEVDGPLLTLAKSTLDLTGTGSATQSVGSVTLNAGQSAITRSSGTSVLRMNQINRIAGGTVDFASGGIADTDSVNVNGILASTLGQVGFATVAGANWAMSADTGTNLAITALASYQANTAGITASISPNNADNVDMSAGDTTLVTADTINSLRFNGASPRTILLGQALTVTSGGILNTATVGANTNTITGFGTLTSTELKIHQYNTSAPLRIDAPVAALTKSGPGTLILGSWTANSGIVVVNGGELDLDKSGAQAIGGALTINQNGIVKYTGSYNDMIGAVAITINENGQLDFNGATDTIGAISITSTGATGNTTPLKNSTPASGNLTITTLGITPLTGYKTLIDTGSGGTLTLGGNVNFIAAGSGWAQISGNLSLSNRTCDFGVADGDAFNDMVVDATIVGGGASGALSKSGAGRLVLSRNNSYDGLTTISDGFLNIQNGNALGTTVGGTVVNSGARTLELQGGITVGAETLTLNGLGVLVAPAGSNVGALRNVSGTNTWGGTVTLGLASRINSDSGLLKLTNNVSLGALALTVGGLGNAGDVEINGVISSTSTAGTLTKDGLGKLTLGGSSANTFSGLTTVNQGTLVLNKTSGVAVSNLTIIGGSYPVSAGLVRYAAGASNPMISGTVTINASANGCGQLDFNGATDTITNVTIDATSAISDSRPIVNTGSGGVLTINSLTITPVAQYISTLDSGSGTFRLGGDVTFIAANDSRQAMIAGNLDLNGTRRFNVPDPGTGRGPIYDLGISAAITNGSLTKIGTGRLYLSGVNTYTGTTLVQTGTVEVALGGSIAASANVTVNTNAILQLDNANALGSSAVVSLLSNGGASKATLNLNFAGIQTVGRLYLDGVSQRPGVTYGSATSGAMYTNSFFTGPGLLMAGGGELSIVNLPVTAITTNSATFNGSLWATGTTASAVCVLWGTANGGQSWSWQNTNWFNGGMPNAAWGNNALFSTNIAGLPRNTVYYYTYAATNTEAAVFATPSVVWGTAEEYYVSTNGTQTAPYDTWDKAYTNLQTVLTLTAGRQQATIIYLAGGQTLTNYAGGADADSVFLWQNATNVTLSGGWDTNAAPPDTRTTATILRGPGVGGTRRVLNMSGVANAVIDTVTIRDGYSASGVNPNGGFGVQLLNCWNVTLANSTITGNGNNPNPQVGRYGAGLCVNGGSVMVTNTLIVSNKCEGGGTGANMGGGIAVINGGSLTLRRSVIDRNIAFHTSNGGHGGGGFYVGSGATLGLYETVVTANTNRFPFSIVPGGAGRNDGGTLTMQNCLVADNMDTPNVCGGIYLYSGSATFVNCTIVTNGGFGVQYRSGAVAMTNCIVRGHSTNDLRSLPKDANGVMTGVWYSGIGDGQNNGVQGCTSVDPLFADTTYYHLQSTATLGTYTGGYFTGGTWGTSASDSPLIDFGDTNSPYSREPAPNGSRINLGYDGNTEVASMTAAQTDRPATVVNLGATLVGHRSAVLNGQVTDTGYPRALTCFRYWAVGSGPTTETARVERQLGVFSATVAPLTPGTPYQYVVVASNLNAEVLSSVASFSTHPTPSYLYVATNGNNTAGTDWVTAYPSVQTALNFAEPGDTIYVAGHTFAGGIAFDTPAHPYNAFLIWQNATNIAIRGGYDAEAGKGGSDPGARSSTTTVKRTVGNVRVLSMIGLTNCTLDQVTIREGQGAVGGGCGLYVTNCWDVTFANGAIVFNTNNVGSAVGAGILLDSGYVVLTNTTISDNYGSQDYSGGAGIYVAKLGSMKVIRSFLLRNTQVSGGNQSYGAGFCVGQARNQWPGGSLEMIESVVSGNKTTGVGAYGGGGYVYKGILSMRNCLVSSNQSSRINSADGIQVGCGTGVFVNCTFAMNNAMGIQFAGDDSLEISYGGTVAMTNCIVWGHTVADMTNFPASVGGVLSNVAYSCFGKVKGRGYGDSTAVMANDYVNSRCITNNPLFVDAAAGNFRLQSTTWATQSLGINAGFNDLSWMMYGNDLAGQPRILNVTVDMGAYENAVPSKGTVLLFR
jgi:autotransporter-associated beta strand protein